MESVFTIICSKQECVIVTTGELKKNPQERIPIYHLGVDERIEFTLRTFTIRTLFIEKKSLKSRI